MSKTFRRIFSIMITSILTFGLFAACTPAGNGDNPNAPYTKKGSIKILSISNSYGDDSVKYLWSLLKATGRYDEIIVGHLYRGGCDIDTHYDYITKGTKGYRYYYNDSGDYSWRANVSSNEAIASQDWDIIVTAQASAKTYDSNSFSNAQPLLDKFKELATNPDVKICWNMTWCYQTVGAEYGGSQTSFMTNVFNNIKNTIAPMGDIAAVIPSGTVIQDLRSSYIGNTLNRDGSHLELGIASYSVGLAWLGAITGYNTDNMQWTPDDQPEVKARLNVIKECVKNALNKPFEITNSQYTESDGLDFTKDSVIINAIGKDFSAYKTAEIEWMKGKWYNYKRDKSTPSTSNFYYCTQLYTPETLPVGSIIVVDDLYSVMPVKFKDTDTLDPDQNAARYDCHLSAEKIIIVDEAFWNNNKFVTFNISHYSDELNLSYMNEGGIRIYVPKN
ncbi:MAG: DUF4886 domain-containing protein [Clostridia bacterium]|nr:DUF4886 domain-containing protein [Clostridia bacterium]